MKATPNLDFTHVKFEKTSFHHFVQMLKNIYQNLVTLINGNVGFGDGTNIDNISGNWINVVAPVAPNTDFTVNHNLNRLPVGYWVMQADRACDVYTGGVAATITQLTLRATVASAVLRIFVICFLLSLFTFSVHAQNTNVSGAVTDADGQTWNNGTYTFNFVPAPRFNGVYRQNGTPFTPTSPSGALSSTGTFTNVVVSDNNQITPSGTQWTITVCGQTGFICYTSPPITITGASQTITGSITPPAISVTCGAQTVAYRDSEVKCGIGGEYYDLINQVVKVCQVSSAGVCTQWASGAGITLDTIANGNSYAKHSFIEGPLPIVYNGDFEGGDGVLAPIPLPPPDWFPNGNMTCSYETAAPYEGLRSLKCLSNTDVSGAAVFSVDVIPVTPGETFYVRGAVKTSGGVTASIVVRWLDKDFQATTAFPGDALVASSSSGSWTLVSAIGVVPASAILANVELISTPFGTAGTTWFDFISVYRVSYPGPISASSLTATGLTPSRCVEAGAGGLLTTIGTSCSGAGGSVTSFSSGNLAPIFTTSVATATTTPAQTFSLSNAAANTVLGNCTSGSAAPTYCSITGAMLPGGGSVSSVGLNLPPQYSISGSPVTSTGTLTGAWTPEPSNYVLAGPATNSIGGIFDGTSGINGTSSSPSTSLTPSTAHDWAWVVVQASGQSSAPTMPGGWTRNFTNGNAGATFHQVFSSNATITAPVTLSASGNWADILFLLRLPGGSPTIVQSQNTTGAFTSATNTFSSNTTTGNSILAIFCGVPASGTTSAKFTDVQLNIYTQLGYAQNSTNEVCIAAMTATIVGGTTDPVTVTVSGSNTGAFFLTMEVSNIAAATGEPVFRALLPGDFPANISGPPVQVFSATTLGGDVAVSATTQTTVMTRTVTMPATGCPCRAFMSYSLYVNTASSGVGYSFWISDGTNNMAGVNAGQSNASSGALTGATYSGYSTGTYSNGAVITFTLLTEGDHTYTVKAASQLAGNAPNSSFQVAISTSN